MIKNLLTCLALLVAVQGFAQWTQMGNTPFTRHHGIGFSLDGVGYILTGSVPGTIATRRFHKYDVATDEWEKLEDYPGPNRSYGIGDSWDGKYYFGFGVDGNFNDLNDLWVFDPTTMGFEELPSCPCAGRSHPAFAAMDGKIYMGMGDDNTGNKNDWWSFDIATETWEQKANIPNPRHHPYMFVIGDKIYVGGGHLMDWHEYNAEEDKWKQITSLDDRVAGTQFSYEGKGYALSGVDVNHDIMATGEFWEYDAGIDQWTELDPHPGVSRFAGHEGFFTTVNTMYSYDMNQLVSNVDELVSENSISIFPNPAQDVVAIQHTDGMDLSEATYMIYNVAGSLVANGLVQDNQVSISALAPGSYFMNIINEDEVSRVKLIKQ